MEHWIETTKSDPEILKKAKQVQGEIERKAQTQRDAIAAIFGGGGSSGSNETAGDTEPTDTSEEASGTSQSQSQSRSRRSKPSSEQ